MPRFSDYVVYVDESGDHSLVNVNPQFPYFVLSFCIFPVNEYVDHVVPRVQRLKFDFFGHDMVVLHEREIRKSTPPFDILLNERVRADFMRALNDIIEAARFGIVACVIDKERFRQRRGMNTNPYHVALEFGLERVFLQLQQRGQARRMTRVVFESRGSKEDHALELEFRRIMDTTAMRGMPETLAFHCAPKSANSSGLQIADMTARPIGLHEMRPEQRNRAWQLIEPKLVRLREGRIDGYGLKVYP
ncbi:DUF3800 domain-containing protein [Microbacterium gorillae]|uniref:DUF3800 domain-containing protein n=1 Tax=Microbacterium gorillae TaxID=1231063 RepID=UPI00058DB9A9|nr:DUF3800 domain-containing protein [Microbacterium gorillae]